MCADVHQGIPAALQQPHGSPEDISPSQPVPLTCTLPEASSTILSWAASSGWLCSLPTSSFPCSSLPEGGTEGVLPRPSRKKPPPATPPLFSGIFRAPPRPAHCSSELRPALWPRPLTHPTKVLAALRPRPRSEELLEPGRLSAVVHHLHAGVARVALGLDEALGRELCQACGPGPTAPLYPAGPAGPVLHWTALIS